MAPNPALMPDPFPQVAFRLRAGEFDSMEFFQMVKTRVPGYAMFTILDEEDGEMPGSVQFAVGTASSAVDDVARWLKTLPFVISVLPSYGG